MKKDIETSWYIFDTTSKKEQNSGDCVVRSISLAMGKTWQEVYSDLCTIGAKLYRMPNESQVFERYLKEQGWEKHPAPRVNGNHRVLAKDFAISTKEICIAKVGAHHLSCIINNKIHDIWNCGLKSVGNYWTKKQD